MYSDSCRAALYNLVSSLLQRASGPWQSDRKISVANLVANAANWQPFACYSCEVEGVQSAEAHVAVSFETWERPLCTHAKTKSAPKPN